MSILGNILNAGNESDEELLNQEIDVTETIADNIDADGEQIAAAVSDVDRAGQVTEILEQQDKVVEKAIEDNDGKLPETVAASTVLVRRAAATALGVDPDSELGEQIVDEEGLEALVNGYALESSDDKKKGVFAKIRDGIVDAINWIKEKLIAFYRKIMMFFTSMSKNGAKTYDELKDLKEETFKANMASITSEEIKSYGHILGANGLVKFSDVQSAIDEIRGKLAKGNQFISDVTKEISKGDEEKLKGRIKEFDKDVHKILSFSQVVGCHEITVKEDKGKVKCVRSTRASKLPSDLKNVKKDDLLNNLKLSDKLFRSMNDRFWGTNNTLNDISKTLDAVRSDSKVVAKVSGLLQSYATLYSSIVQSACQIGTSSAKEYMLLAKRAMRSKPNKANDKAKAKAE